MNILALDLGTRSGFAHSCGISGSWHLPSKPDESPGMRLLRLRGKLQEILDTVGIELVAYEAVSVFQGKKASVAAVKLQSKMAGVVEVFCEEHQLECCTFNLQSIKMHALPEKGAKRDKAAMLRAARKKWPQIEISSDDEADALWLLDLVQKELGYDTGYSRQDGRLRPK